MNRAQFMEELAQLLLDIPQEDREETLEFYENYFDDAGEENESRILEEFGSPEKLALSIRYNLRDGNEAYAEYTECGYEDIRTKEKDKIPDAYTVVGHSRIKKEYYDEEFEKKFEDKQGKGNHAKLILAIILMVLLSPVFKGVIGGLLGLLAAITIALLAVGFLFPVAGLLVAFLLTFVCAVGGVAAIVFGIYLIFINVAVGILMCGIGFLLLAMMFGGWSLMKWMLKTVLPGSIRRFTEMCSRWFYHFRKAGAKQK